MVEIMKREPFQHGQGHPDRMGHDCMPCRFRKFNEAVKDGAIQQP